MNIDNIIEDTNINIFLQNMDDHNLNSIINMFNNRLYSIALDLINTNNSTELKSCDIFYKLLEIQFKSNCDKYFSATLYDIKYIDTIKYDNLMSAGSDKEEKTGSYITRKIASIIQSYLDRKFDPNKIDNNLREGAKERKEYAAKIRDRRHHMHSKKRR